MLDKEHIRRANALEEVVAELTGHAPRRAGHELTFPCPFHPHDDHESLEVRIDTQVWICWSCGATGDVVDFVAQQQRLDFRAALGWLAERVGIVPVSAPPSSPPDEIYLYHDGEGRLLFEEVHYNPISPGTSKRVCFRRPDGHGGWIWDHGDTWVPWGLAELLAADPSEPVHIAQGPKDATRLRELGLLATTSPCGAGTWPREFTEYVSGRHIVLWRDHDPAGAKHVETVARSLKGQAASLKIPDLPDLPVKGDVSDWLDAGHTLVELLVLVDAARHYTATLEEATPAESVESADGDGPSLDGVARDARLPDLTARSSAEEVRDRLHAYAAFFAFADAEQREAAKRHASTVLRACSVRSAGRAVAAAFATAAVRGAAAVDACGASDERYAVQHGHVVRRKATRFGPVEEPLCNFEARITEELIADDGITSALSFVVDGTLESGESLPRVRVPASRFARMNWVSESWGVRAVVCAGQSTRDSLREAIQRLSPSVDRRRIYTHTGWRQTDVGWVYLTSTGAVGPQRCEVEIGTELARYALPLQPTDPIEAMRTSLRLLHLAPFHVTVPLFAATFRAPLASALPADLTLWMEGPTGSLKSTLAALFQSHYGPFDRTHLPGAWSATANHLEARAFALKDTLFVIDEWVPTPLDARELEQKASRLIRAQGNGTGRGRLRSDLTPRLTSRPRGLIVSTGEQHPTGHSVLARTLIVDVRRDHIDLAALGVAQATAHRLPHAMAAFVTWLAPHMDGLSAKLRLAFDGARTRASQGIEHLRIPEVVAHLWIGLDVALQFAVDIGACTPAEDEALRRGGWAALLHVATAQARLLDGERPTQRFLEVLAGLLDQDRVAVIPKSEDPEPRDARDPRPFIGWCDGAFLYLLPEAVYGAVIRSCRETGEPFPVRQITLATALTREGHLEHAPDRHSKVERLGGKNRRVWKVKRAALDAVAPDDVRPPER